MKVFVINQEQLVRYALLTLAAVVLSFLLGFLSALQLATPQPSEVSGVQLSQDTEQADTDEAADSTQAPGSDSADESTEATAAEAEKKSQPEVTTEQKTAQPKPKPAPAPAKAELPEKKPEQPATAETTSAGQSASASNQRVYSIQAGMFASKTNAQNFIDKLSEKDFAAYVAEFVSSDGTVKYNVRVGQFSSREQARERLKDYQQFFSSPAYVVIAQ